MSREKNSWLQKINRGITKVGETIGAPIRKPIERHYKSEKMMREGGLSSSVMGSKSYGNAFKSVKDFLKENNISAAKNYILEQKKKISEQSK